MNTPRIWDKEVDIIVIGYGFAGAVAAIEAHDAGAQTLIMEKERHPAGCSPAASGGIMCCNDAQKMFSYLRCSAAGRVPDAILKEFCDELTKNEQYMRKLAEIDGATFRTPRSMKEMGGAIFDHEGREAMYVLMPDQIPGFTESPSWFPGAVKVAGIETGRVPGGMVLMKILMDNVESRNIELMYRTAGKKLVRDPETQDILGVIAESEGKTLTVKARKAVILACGGYENNQEFYKKFCQGIKYISYCHASNTGDGITMAQAVGADIGGMWNLHGSYGFEIPGFKTGFRHCGPAGNMGRYNRLRPTPWIVVDKMGSRYMNEFAPMGADLNHRPMEIFDGSLWMKPFYNPGDNGYPRIPSWVIFDEEGRNWGPIANTSWENYKWSQDNSEEVEKGWILKGNTLEELCDKINADPDSEKKMDVHALRATLEKWNATLRSGVEFDEFRRGARSFYKPIEKAPYYAMKAWPLVTNTHGGLTRDEKHRVLDVFGDPIARLYVAGELGAMIRHVYETAANIGDCITSGRAAGRMAAAETPSNN